jgi:hypothetical protein
VKKLLKATPAIAVLLLLTVVWMVGLSIGSEPTYQGVPLNKWLRQITNPEGAEQPEQAAEAVRHIGTNGIPYLLAWIRYEASSWHYWVDQRRSYMPERLAYWLLDRPALQADRAVRGFESLGSSANCAVPSLTRLMNDPKATESSERAMRALAHIGERGLTVLAAALTNSSTPKPRRYTLLSCMGGELTGGVNTDAVLPSILQCCNDKDRHIAEQAWEFVLWRLAPEEQHYAVPLNLLASRGPTGRARLLDVLNRLDESSRAAVPAVRRLLDASSLVTREAATNALRRIAPELPFEP